jgi:hypothetical protein
VFAVDCPNADVTEKTVRNRKIVIAFMDSLGALMIFGEFALVIHVEANLNRIFDLLRHPILSELDSIFASLVPFQRGCVQFGGATRVDKLYREQFSRSVDGSLQINNAFFIFYSRLSSEQRSARAVMPFS